MSLFQKIPYFPTINHLNLTFLVKNYYTNIFYSQKATLFFNYQDISKGRNRLTVRNGKEQPYGQGWRGTDLRAGLGRNRLTVRVGKEQTYGHG